MRQAGCVAWVAALSLSSALAATGRWHHGLARPGGGYWQARVRVTVTNEAGQDAEGRPVEIRVGTGKGEVPLAGWRVAALRVCNAEGAELLWELLGADGEARREGAVAAGDRLLFGVEAEAGGTALYYVYGDNPEALPVAEFFGAKRPFANGGFEKGTGDTPARWEPVEIDGQHRMAWVAESPHGGTRCARCTVDPGAAPSWVKYVQRGIRVLPDADYRLEAWVKARDTKGSVGWFIHVHGDEPMAVNKTQSAGDGTYDWRKMTVDFRTPPDAVSLTVGTVLRGTGTAWYDDAKLTRLTEARKPLPAVAGQVERLELAVEPAPEGWRVRRADYRAALTVRNWSGEAARPLASVRLGPLTRRLPVELRTLPVRVIDPATGKTVPAVRMEEQLAFAAAVPARAEKTYHAYFAPITGRRDKTMAMEYANLVASPANLVKNPGFEEGKPLPARWEHSAQSDQPADKIPHAARGTDAHSGEACAKLVVPPEAPLGWSGWHQNVPVKPDTTYLYAAWLRCEDVDGSVQLHGHSHQADGSRSAVTPFFGVGPGLSGTQGWTLLHGIIHTPRDAAMVRLHLTMNAHGAVWHDDVFFGEATHALVGPTEPRRPFRDRAAEGRGYTAWSVNPLVKVFPEDMPGKPVTRIELSAARNECEVFQIALRAMEDLRDVTVTVAPPRHRDGATLPVGLRRVGYVPIDHPTNYYRTNVESWYRKRPPPGAAGCDGWAGLWPDPLPPLEPFSIEAANTQPVWGTVRVPEDAPAGAYRGLVTVKPEDAPEMKIVLYVRVRGFAIPKTSHLRVIYDFREHFIRRYPIEGKTRTERLKQWYRLMADHRVCPGILPAPKFSHQDGRYQMDTTDFDWAAAYCLDELGMNVFYTPWLFYSFGWAREPKKLFGHEPFTPEHTEAYTTCLKLYVEHLREKGWLDKVVLYVSDEPHFRHEHIKEQMIRVCEMIQSAWPEAPIYSSTWRHCPAWNGLITVWGVGQYGCFPVETMRERKAAGDRLWFTTDGQMCTDTPYLACERLLPWYCWKYGVEAYEFWGVNWYTYDPWDYGWHRYIRQSPDGENYFYVRYPNGDGYLAYPGAPIGHDGPVPSIRLAQAREGVEDYEYLRLLDQLIAKAKAAGLDTIPARRVRDQAETLIDIPNAGGRYSTRILPDPALVDQHREAVARAIERLSRRLR
ncbi:MAG: glycoside hydrolase domain-containing protein [Planctomycetota bacterium]